MAMTLVSREIEEYAARHTTPLPNYLQELIHSTYQQTQVPEMLSGPIEGSLLYLLAWVSGARHTLDIGTFTGFSAQAVAAALPEDGVVVTCEIDPEHADIARKHFEKSPHGHKIELRLGPALETLKTLSGPFDLVFIDADKQPYYQYYERALEMLAPRGIIAVDNVLRQGRVLNPQTDSDWSVDQFNQRVADDPRVYQLLLPIRDGVMLIWRA